MNLIKVRNVHQALPLALQILKTVGIESESRNGPVYQAPGPVTTTYAAPMERVMFWPERDANPFFHFFESLWMLGGRADTESVCRFVRTMIKYSDDGEIFWGAYGYRWRKGMPMDIRKQDQLEMIIGLLQQNRRDRRGVLQMWDSASDLGKDFKDVPCNTMATFQVSPESGRLDMTVFCRSNDIVLGCYGANAVHFSMLLELVARASGLTPGEYHQISVNWHSYHETFSPLVQRFLDRNPESLEITREVILDNPYEGEGKVEPFPIMNRATSFEEWDRDLNKILLAKGRAPIGANFVDPFFEHVAVPILRAHDSFKEGRKYDDAYAHLNKCAASDWRRACFEWLNRREMKDNLK